jgi:hypothetical protein
MARPLPIRLLAAAGLAVSLYLTCPALPAFAAAAAPTAPDQTAATSQKVGGIVDNSGSATSIPGKEYTLTPKTGDAALQPLIGRFANILVGISGSIALLVFVWAGITMIRANGDAKAIDEAKRMMTWTAIGLAVIFLSEALVRFVLGALLQGTVS